MNSSGKLVYCRALNSEADLRVRFETENGRARVDTRVWFTPVGNIERVPTRKGVTISSREMLREVIDAFTTIYEHWDQPALIDDLDRTFKEFDD